MLQPVEDAEPVARTSLVPGGATGAGAGITQSASSAPTVTIDGRGSRSRTPFLSLGQPRVGAEAANVPRWISPWREALILVVLWACYTATRSAGDQDLGIALKHAASILKVEKFFHIDFEHSLNTGIAHVMPLEVVASYWYSMSHYIVTIATLIALYRLRPHAYGWMRTSLVSATLAALLCYVLYPTAPPRLSGDYTDTLVHTAKFGWWDNHASIPRGLGGATNQLAAMPSMHVGWALWCTIVLYGLSRYTWQRETARAALNRCHAVPPRGRTRCRHSGQSRCKSEPDDHGDGGAGNGRNPGQPGCPDDKHPRAVDPVEPAGGVSQHGEDAAAAAFFGPAGRRVAARSAISACRRASHASSRPWLLVATPTERQPNTG